MLDEVLHRTKLTSPQELFVHDLGAALQMETTGERMLGKLIQEANDSGLRQQLRRHQEETQAQIRNLHHAFEVLGMEPETSTCPAIEGIEKEGDANLKLAGDALKDDVVLAGCAAAEHHEIAVYENLIVHADVLGEEDVVALLRENLEQEQHTLGEVLKAAVANAQQRRGVAA